MKKTSLPHRYKTNERLLLQKSSIRNRIDRNDQLSLNRVYYEAVEAKKDLMTFRQQMELLYPDHEIEELLEFERMFLKELEGLDVDVDDDRNLEIRNHSEDETQGEHDNDEQEVLESKECIDEYADPELDALIEQLLDFEKLTLDPQSKVTEEHPSDSPSNSK